MRARTYPFLSPPSVDEFAKAAKLTPKVCGHDSKRWEDWIFVFAEKRQLQASPFPPMILFPVRGLGTYGPLHRSLFLTFLLNHQDLIIWSMK